MKERIIAESEKILDVIQEGIELYNRGIMELRAGGYWQAGEIIGITCFSEERDTCGMYQLKRGDLARDISHGQISRDHHFIEQTTIKTAGPARRRKAARDIAKILGRQPDWVCVYCGGPGDPEYGPDDRRWHIDHLYAQVNGGDGGKDNLVLSCATCNISKGAKFLREHLDRVLTGKGRVGA